MWVKILIVVVAVIVVLLLVIAMRPSTFRVERSVVIDAPPEAAFALVNDFHAWPAWSPWEKKDPGMNRSYGGPPAGVGATYAWDGDKNVGSGRMTIERSERPSLVGIKLEFFKPFAGTNAVNISFTPTAQGTRVNWVMDGRYNFITKGFSMVMDMDKMIGNDFEAGLAAIKAQAEAGARAGSGATAAAN